ncbi:hypothetical protein ACHAW5_010487 [Stephanodiscus triporus]|uniref:Uncharacterized protein n=1 Tax=Stephanodiscus triporus TaxID=2934178 RepID=A0ABD3MND4_9STRA
MSSTMPSQSFADPHAPPSPILSTSPRQRDGGHNHHHHRRRRPHVELSSCQESYRLFKRCSTASKMECYSCSDAVASYMRWKKPSRRSVAILGDRHEPDVYFAVSSLLDAATATR